MKKFHWPLQRLMNVTAGREKALRNEVFGAWQRCKAINSKIIARQESLQRVLNNLGMLEISQRLSSQHVFTCALPAHVDAIKKLQNALDDEKKKRQRLTEQLMEIRSRLKTLERKCEEARMAHQRQQMAVEQKQFDESAQVAYNRSSALTATAGRREA